MSGGKSAHVHMRMTPALKESLEQQAKRMHIDLSALISMVLSEWLETRKPAPKNGTTTNEPHEAAAREDTP